MVRPTPLPAKAVLVMRRIPFKRVAAAGGLSPHYVYRTLNGWVPPSERFRQTVLALLGDVAEDDLFGDAA